VFKICPLNYRRICTILSSRWNGLSHSTIISIKVKMEVITVAATPTTSRPRSPTICGLINEGSIVLKRKKSWSPLSCFNANCIENNGGSTKPAMATQKHPMKLTMWTNPGAYSARIVQTTHNRTRMVTFWEKWSVSSIPNFPSMSSPQGTTIRGAVTAT